MLTSVSGTSFSCRMLLLLSVAPTQQANKKSALKQGVELGTEMSHSKA